MYIFVLVVRILSPSVCRLIKRHLLKVRQPYTTLSLDSRHLCILLISSSIFFTSHALFTFHFAGFSSKKDSTINSRERNKESVAETQISSEFSYIIGEQDGYKPSRKFKRESCSNFILFIASLASSSSRSSCCFTARLVLPPVPAQCEH